MDEIPGPVAVELVPHRAEWAAMADAKTRRLERALGAVLIRVHHIGSTAIAGIKAKPIVDLIPIVTNLDALDAAKEAVRALGYRWHGEYGLAGRRYCTFTDPQTARRIFQLHCYGEGDPQVGRHLAFRDYLRVHPAVAREYEAEKIRAAAAAPHDTNAYNDEKNAWIKRAEKAALEWAAIRRPAP